MASFRESVEAIGIRYKEIDLDHVATFRNPANPPCAIKSLSFRI